MSSHRYVPPREHMIQPAPQNESQEAKRERESRTILCENIDYSSSQSQVRKLFEKKIGSVKSVDLVMDRDGRSRGIAYIEFYSQVHALRALQDLQGFQYKSKRIRIKPIGQQEFMSSLSSAAGANDHSTGYAALHPAQLILDDLKKSKIRPTQCIYIQDFIMSKSTLAQMRHILEPYGRIDDIFLSESEPYFALVTFSKLEAAAEAVSVLDGSINLGATAEKPLRLEFSIHGDDVVTDPKPQKVTPIPPVVSAGAILPQGVIPSQTSLGSTLTPSKYLMLKNVFDPVRAHSKKSFSWILYLFDDIELLLEENIQVPVYHIALDRYNPQGLVYMSFQSIDHARQAFAYINHRFYHGRMLTCDFLKENEYLLKYPQANPDLLTEEEKNQLFSGTDIDSNLQNKSLSEPQPMLNPTQIPPRQNCHQQQPHQHLKLLLSP